MGNRFESNRIRFQRVRRWKSRREKRLISVTAAHIRRRGRALGWTRRGGEARTTPRSALDGSARRVSGAPGRAGRPPEECEASLRVRLGNSKHTPREPSRWGLRNARRSPRVWTRWTGSCTSQGGPVQLDRPRWTGNCTGRGGPGKVDRELRRPTWTGNICVYITVFGSLAPSREKHNEFEDFGPI